MLNLVFGLNISTAKLDIWILFQAFFCSASLAVKKAIQAV
jgi:hypothetical protein